MWVARAGLSPYMIPVVLWSLKWIDAVDTLSPIIQVKLLFENPQVPDVPPQWGAA